MSDNEQVRASQAEQLAVATGVEGWRPLVTDDMVAKAVEAYSARGHYVFDREDMRAAIEAIVPDLLDRA